MEAHNDGSAETMTLPAASNIAAVECLALPTISPLPSTTTPVPNGKSSQDIADCSVSLPAKKSSLKRKHIVATCSSTPTTSSHPIKPTVSQPSTCPPSKRLRSNRRGVRFDLKKNTKILTYSRAEYDRRIPLSEWWRKFEREDISVEEVIDVYYQLDIFKLKEMSIHEDSQDNLRLDVVTTREHIETVKGLEMTELESMGTELKKQLLGFPDIDGGANSNQTTTSKDNQRRMKMKKKGKKSRQVLNGEDSSILNQKDALQGRKRKLNAAKKNKRKQKWKMG